jgi:hypothetical protein
VKPAPAGDAPEDGEEPVELGGLLGGLTAWHLRMLCETPWEGGGGSVPPDLFHWTLDQVWFRLCDKDLLKHPVGGRVEKMESLQATGALKRYEDGTFAGRAADGTPIRGRIGGESVAARLAREQAEREGKKKKRRRRKG